MYSDTSRAARRDVFDRALWRSILWLFVILAWPLTRVRGDELSALEKEKDLTPRRFARACAGFRFELSDELQDPAAFLRRKRGDCADFANVANLVLREHGYHTKLVVIMMQGQTHVVCYVREAGGFLDFNHRRDAQPIVKSDGSLADIADKVAADFRSPWWLVSQFRYADKQPVYLDTVFPKAKALAVATHARGTVLTR